MTTSACCWATATGGFASRPELRRRQPARRPSSLGDFNGDGKLDVVTANAAAGTVSVLRGHGDGTFSTAENFAAGSSPSAVAVGDFNGDGWLDVATANADANTVSVLLNDRAWPSVPPTVSDRRRDGHGRQHRHRQRHLHRHPLGRLRRQTVTVHYATANGTATAGSDYQAASRHADLRPPARPARPSPCWSSATASREPNETFVVNLSSPTNATIADGQGVGTILDDEPRISISDVTKTEGKKNQTTLFTFTVTLSAAYDQPVTMSFRTVDGTATTERQRLRRQDRHADLRPRRDDEDDHHRSQGRQQEGGQRDVLPGPVRQQQQFAVHQEPRHRHDPERRLSADGGGVSCPPSSPCRR